MRYISGISIAIALVAFVFFVNFQTQGIYGGDSGDLVTAAVTFGVPHPPGYPLYTLSGLIISKIPILTPAWRVSLLSSIPGAATLGLVFMIVATVTGQLLPALFSVFILAGNYLFFLYSVTPEVFALLNLFISLLLLLCIRFFETKNIRFLYGACVVFGLSLTHHHVILFFVPCMVYILYKALQREKSRFVKSKLLVTCVLLILVGLLPYVYVPFAAGGKSMINWDRAIDVSGFTRLITRADYGSFVSGGFYGTELIHRFLSLKAFVQFVFIDFSWIGIILALCGFGLLCKIKRVIGIGLGLAFMFLGPFFFFYASFPLMNRFTVGTYERFLLPSYIFLALAAGIGFSGVIRTILSIFKAKKLYAHVIVSIVIILFFLYPAGRIYSTVWRFWGIATDKTAENLGIDLLTSLPEQSIVLLAQDTPLFITQYVRYAQDYRRDIAVIHAHLLENAEFFITLKKAFPQLVVPADTSDGAIVSFIRVNADHFPIFANRQFPLPSGWFWIPWGMTYKLTKQEDLPKLSDLKSNNDGIWAHYHNPTTGILSRYNHLMLADVRDVYAGSRITYGKILLRGGLLPQARSQFQEAVSLAGDTYLPDAYTYLGLTAMFEGACKEARTAFEEARNVSLSADSSLTLYEASLARDCEKNPARAQVLLEKYEQEKRLGDIPLE